MVRALSPDRSAGLVLLLFVTMGAVGVLKKSPGTLPGFLPGNYCDMAPPIIFKHHFLVPRMGTTH